MPTGCQRPRTTQATRHNMTAPSLFSSLCWALEESKNNCVFFVFFFFYWPQHEETANVLAVNKWARKRERERILIMLWWWWSTRRWRSRWIGVVTSAHFSSPIIWRPIKNKRIRFAGQNHNITQQDPFWQMEMRAITITIVRVGRVSFSFSRSDSATLCCSCCASFYRLSNVPPVCHSTRSSFANEKNKRHQNGPHPQGSSPLFFFDDEYNE